MKVETLFGIEEIADPILTTKFDDRYGDKYKSEWLTPPYVLRALGEFDLDPCAPVNSPWQIAKTHFTIVDNGFLKKWFGRVFCNPPYDNAHIWMRKLSEHGNGIALIFARTETKAFFPYVWEYADAVFFFKRRLSFYHVSGVGAPASAGAPSCLIAYGKENVISLEKSGLDGKLIYL